MDKKVYKREEVSPNKYKVLGGDSSLLKNHKNKPYPVLSENMSRNLIEDLNAINAKNRKLILQDNSEKEANRKITLHDLSSIELNESLCYCVISSLMQYEAAEMTTQLEFENQIQWDRLFRLTPGPPNLLIELKNTQKCRAFFGEDYMNLQLNYSNSIEEMEENETPFVSKGITTLVSELFQNMSMAEKVIVELLYNSFNYFSITIPILWVAEKIDDEDFMAAHYALNMGVDIYEMKDEELEGLQFDVKRLIHLNDLKQAYLEKDQTLPCVNFH